MAVFSSFSDFYNFNTAARQEVYLEQPPKQTLTAYEAWEKFCDEMRKEDLLPPPEMPGSGEMTRCPDIDDRGGETSGWYIFFDDAPAAGAYGDWRQGFTLNWCSKTEIEMSLEERICYSKNMDRARKLREQEREQKAAAAMEAAATDWEKATPADAHPYLTAKGVKSYGLKILNGRLLVPVCDVNGAMLSYQTIEADGAKKFKPGTQKKGNFFKIPGKGRIAICEGYATGASIHEATGWTVLVAFDAGNLQPVAEEWQAVCPQDEIVICGDDDRFNEVNTGREKAEAAAAAVGTRAVFPVFPQNCGGKPTDFNDLMAISGLQETRRQLTDQAAGDAKRKPISDWGLEAFAGPAPERKWLVENTFPLGCVSVFAAMGDAGKGYIGLDLGLKVAGKYPPDNESIFDLNPAVMAFGNRVVTRGPVVIFSAEDSKDEIHRRLEQLGTGDAKDLYIVPLPDDGGPMPLIVPGKNGPILTPEWHAIVEQLERIKPVLIIFDPLASFVMADINADPAVGAFTMGTLSELAQKTGAAILVPHHLTKTADNIETPEHARRLIRGTSAIVDNSRAAYVLWQCQEKRAKTICKALGVEFKRNRVFFGCLVKSNGPGDREIKQFVRNDFGLLEVQNEAVKQAVSNDRPIQLETLVEVIAEAAERGQPYCYSGINGIADGRMYELPQELRSLGRNQIRDLVNEALNDGSIQKCIAKGSTSKKYLDVPGGNFALGKGEIITGAIDGKNEKNEKN